MCNQTAGLSRCLTRVQDAMSSQLKSLHLDSSKGKSSERMRQAVDELDYLVTFNRSISEAMARTMQNLLKGMPQTTTRTILLTLSQPLVGPKSTLINQNTSRGPDFYPHLQRRISPLNIGIGPLSPLGSPTLIRTTPNMPLTLLITGK